MHLFFVIDCFPQGRITSYMKNTGEEAIQIGVAEAMKPGSVISLFTFASPTLIVLITFNFLKFLSRIFSTKKQSNFK